MAYLIDGEERHRSIIVQKADETHVIADILLHHALPAHTWNSSVFPIWIHKDTGEENGAYEVEFCLETTVIYANKINFEKKQSKS